MHPRPPSPTVVSPVRRPRAPTLAIAFALSCAACAAAPPPPRAPLRVVGTAEAQVRAFFERLGARDVAGVLALMAPEPTVVDWTVDTSSPLIVHGYRDVHAYYTRLTRAIVGEIVAEYVDPQSSGTIAGWSLHLSNGDGFSGTSAFEMQRGLISRVIIRRRE